MSGGWGFVNSLVFLKGSCLTLNLLSQEYKRPRWTLVKLMDPETQPREVTKRLVTVYQNKSIALA